MSSHMLHYAFEYHDRGWPVIPVLGKTPALPWAAYQKKKTVSRPGQRMVSRKRQLQPGRDHRKNQRACCD
jgi:hypothetical protein